MTHKQEVQEQEAAARLREVLNPGDTVYTVLRHVSRSGMQRTIQLITFKAVSWSPEREPRHIGYNVAEALGLKYDRQREGIKVAGCGMDMGFHLVYELGRALWPEGVGKHKDGGYALNHRWL